MIKFLGDKTGENLEVVGMVRHWMIRQEVTAYERKN
jgi:hypothetical protein